MPAAILLRSLQLMTRGMDRLGVLDRVTYFPRTPGDVYGSGTVFEAKRDPMDDAIGEGLAVTTATWHLYSTEGQTVVPAPMGKLTENGRTWYIPENGRVLTSFGGLKHDLPGCVLEV